MKLLENELSADLRNDKDMATQPENEYIRINVGGVVFETHRDTFDSDSDCKLWDSKFLESHFRPWSQEYFFDRDPLIFAAVLNYLRTNELHLPSNVCSASARMELEFWGIDTFKIERCCWTRYNDLNSHLSAMIRLERTRKSRKGHDDFKRGRTWWQRYRPMVWKFLNHSNSSVAARVLGILSFILALLSLFSFIAATSEPFKITTHSGTSNAGNQSAKSNGTGNGNQGSHHSNDAMLNFMSKHVALNIIDIVCLVYFSIEYLSRLMFAPNRLKYAKSILAVIDILALLPDYVDIVLLFISPELQLKLANLSYGMVIRILRTLRIFRLVRHNTGLLVLMYTIRASIRELMLLVWFLGLGILVFSSLIYFAEDRELFGSIPKSFWWALITMTTVGYGDFYPITGWGKVVGSMCAMSGVLLIGFTVPTLVNNFIMFYGQMKAVKHFERRFAGDGDIVTHM